MSESPIERHETFRESPEERTEQSQAGPTYSDYPQLGTDVGFPLQEPTEPDAVDVQVVNFPDSARDVVDWSVSRVTVGPDKAEQLAGDNRNRTRLFIRNGHTADPVYLVTDAVSPVAFGYELPFGETVELFHNSAVWARCDTGDTVTVSVFTEYVVVNE